ncbi:MAG: hypothetical protein WA842_07090 [Croceibacterium sp.]
MKPPFWLFVAAFFVSRPALAQEDEADFEPVTTIIHSDVPLYGFDWEELWPRGYVDGNSFGCMSRVGFGDWHFTPAADNAYDDEYWQTFSNYGVFHCAVSIHLQRSDETEESRFSDHGFFVRLGTTQHDGQEIELWAIQEGIVPGSTYTLLARPVGDTGPIGRFDVLQQECRAAAMRRAAHLDIYSGAYCAINSRVDLLSLAKRMAKRAPIGTLERIAEPAETEDESPAPAE